jgi:hypothetical protein
LYNLWYLSKIQSIVLFLLFAIIIVSQRNCGHKILLYEFIICTAINFFHVITVNIMMMWTLWYVVVIFLLGLFHFITVAYVLILISCFIGTCYVDFALRFWKIDWKNTFFENNTS